MDAKTLSVGGSELPSASVDKHADSFQECLAVDKHKAVSRPFEKIDGVHTVTDFEEAIDSYYENGLPLGTPLPWKAFQKGDGTYGYTLKTGTTTLWTGWPGHGKSRFVENVCVEAARRDGWKFGYYSPEVQPLALHASYLAAQWAGKPFGSGIVPRMDRTLYELAKEFLCQHFFIFSNDEKPLSVQDILSGATKLVEQHGIKGLVLDPWNNIYHSRMTNEREDEYIGRTLQLINAWRKKNDVWVSIVAHPVKIHLERRDVQPVITQGDVKGGSEWDAMSDFCISVWRDIYDEESLTQVHVQKVRFEHLGTLGCASLKFEKSTGKFFDTGRGFAPAIRSKSAHSAERRTGPKPVRRSTSSLWIGS